MLNMKKIKKFEEESKKKIKSKTKKNEKMYVDMNKFIFIENQ